MNKFMAPEIGKTVTVTTRFRDDYLFRTSDTRDEAITGVVVKNHRLTPPGYFCLYVADSEVPEREIPLVKVVAMTYSDGTQARTSTDAAPEVETRTVTGSKGDTYIVTKRRGNLTCTCTGYQWRKHCKHLNVFTLTA